MLFEPLEAVDVSKRMKLLLVGCDDDQLLWGVVGDVLNRRKLTNWLQALTPMKGKLTISYLLGSELIFLANR